MRPFPAMSCPTGKVRFRDRIGALMAIAGRGRNDQGREKTEARAYRCEQCRGWHLTSWKDKPKPRRR